MEITKDIISKRMDELKQALADCQKKREQILGALNETALLLTLMDLPAFKAVDRLERSIANMDKTQQTEQKDSI